jgi:hypothetical protein
MHSEDMFEILDGISKNSAAPVPETARLKQMDSVLVNHL